MSNIRSNKTPRHLKSNDRASLADAQVDATQIEEELHVQASSSSVGDEGAEYLVSSSAASIASVQENSEEPNETRESQTAFAVSAKDEALRLQTMSASAGDEASQLQAASIASAEDDATLQLDAVPPVPDEDDDLQLEPVSIPSSKGKHVDYARRVRKKKRHLSKPLKILLAFLLVIAAIAAGIIIALCVNNASMQAKITDINKSSNVTVDSASSNGQRITYNGHTYELNPNVVSCLIIGHDDEAVTTSNHTSQADLVAVLALDTSTGEMTLIGIPRDSMVTIDTYGVNADGERAGYIGQEIDHLCLAYNYGTGQEAVDNVKAAVERVLYGVPITYSIDLYEKGVADLNDAIGGVALTALETIDRANVVEGQAVILHGKNAHTYVTYRATAERGSALQRQARQQQYVKAFFSQAVSEAKSDIGIISDLYTVASDNITTNLDVSSAIYLAQCVIGNNFTFDAVTLAGSVDSSGVYDEYYLDNDAVMQTVIDTYYVQVD